MKRRAGQRTLTKGVLLMTAALPPVLAIQAGAQGAAASGMCRNLFKERGHRQTAIDDYWRLPLRRR